MAWLIKSRALRDLRMEKLWSLEVLSENSKLSVRTLGDLEKKDRPVQLATLTSLAKVFAVPPRTLGRQTEATDSDPPAPVPAPSPRAPAAKIPAPRPPLRAYGPGVTELPQLSRLEELVAIEATRPPRPPLAHPNGPIDPLTAKLFQDAFTAYGVHEGRLAYIEGTILAQHGLSPSQASLCGTKSGIGARFHFVFEVAPGHEVAVTIFTASAAHTARLQGFVNASARAIVKIVVAPDDVLQRRGGYEFFATSSLRPWGLEVVEVLEAAPPPPAPKAAGTKARKVARKATKAK